MDESGKLELRTQTGSKYGERKNDVANHTVNAPKESRFTCCGGLYVLCV